MQYVYYHTSILFLYFFIFEIKLHNIILYLYFSPSFPIHVLLLFSQNYMASF